MSTTTLEIKISALVQGLKDVAALSAEFLSASKSVDTLSESSKGLDGLAAKSKQTAQSVSDAFSSLGGRAAEQINLDILTIQASMEALRSSGAPFEVIAEAEASAAAELAKLRAELSDPIAVTFTDNIDKLREGLTGLGDIGKATGEDLNDAFSLLSTRSLYEVTDEINQVKTALASIQGVGSFEEVGIATQEAEEKLKALEEELKRLEESAGPAGDALSEAMTPEMKGKQIADEIHGIVAALEKIKSSGASFETINTAEELAAKKITSLKAAYESLGLSAEATSVDIEKAFSSVGVRSATVISEEIEKIKTSLASLKNSGASFDAISVAETEAAASITKLKEELSSIITTTFSDKVEGLSLGLKGLGETGKTAGKDISDAFSVLTTRSFEEIAVEIQKVKSSLATVQETGSFEEIQRATKLAEVQLKSLQTELEQLTIVATPAAKALSDAMSPEMKGKLIEDEITRIINALTKVKEGGASFEAVAAAEELAATKITQLKEAYQSLTSVAEDSSKNISDAFRSMGGRSSEEIRTEIERIKTALESIKESGASFEDVSRATEIATARIAELNKELDPTSVKTFGQHISDLGDKLRHADFKGAMEEVRGLAASFDLAGGAVKLFLGAWVAKHAFEGLKELTQEVIKLGIEGTKLAAREETLGVTLNVVGRNAGYSQETLEKQAHALEKLGITAEAARESLVKMIQSGISLTELGNEVDKLGNKMTKAQELARMAQDLAVVSGQNSSVTFQRLVLNIQQMDTVGLRYMGLVVSKIQADEKYAATLGITANAMTLTQKRQAFLNATMEEARKLSGSYTEAMETAGKKAQSLVRYHEEFAASFGKMFSPIGAKGLYGTLIDGATEYLDRGRQIIDQFNLTHDTSSKLQKGVENITKGLVELALWFTKVGLEAADAFSSIIEVVGEGAGLVVDTFNSMVISLKAVSESLDNFGEKDFDALLSALNPVALVFRSIALALAIIKDSIQITVGASLDLVGRALNGVGEMIRLVGVLQEKLSTDKGSIERAQQMQYYGEALRDFGKEATAAGDKYVAMAISNDNATMRMMASFNQANKSTKERAESVQHFSKVIEELAEKSRRGALGEELGKGVKGITKDLEHALETGEILKKDFDKLKIQLSSVPGNFLGAFQEASGQAKMNIQQNIANIKGDTASAIAALGQLINVATSGVSDWLAEAGTNTVSASRDILREFQKIASNAGTLEGLAAANEEMAVGFRKGVVNQSDLAKAVERSTLEFDKLVEAGSKTVTTRASMDELVSSMRKFNETPLTGITGQMSEFAVSQEHLARSVQSVALAFIENRSKMANSRQDIVALITDIRKLGDEKIINGDQVAVEVGKVVNAFIDARLKAGTTRQDITKLKEDLMAMGASGHASSGLVAAGLERVAVAAGTARARIKELSDQQVALSNASLAVNQASFNIAKAEVDVIKKRVDLWAAENAFARTGSELDEISVNLAKIDLALAEQQLSFSRTKYQEQVANMDLLIRKQEVLNATANMKNDPGNDKLIMAKEAAEKAALAQELVVNAIKKQVDAQQASLLVTEEAAYKTRALQDIVKSIGDTERKNAEVGITYSASLEKSKLEARELRKSIGEVSTSMETQSFKTGGGLASGIAAVGTAIHNNSEQYRLMGEVAQSAWSTAQNGSAETSSALDNLVLNQNQYNEAAGFGLEKAQGFSTGIDTAAGKADRMVRALKAAKSSVDGLGGAFDSVNEADMSVSGTDALISDLGDVKDGYDDITNATARFADQSISNIRNVERALDNLIAKQNQAKNFSGSTLGGGGYAEGGKIRGPGTGTSDSILMFGSNGEYVLRAAAVEHYGEDIIDRMNNLVLPKSSIPGFASGGMIGGASIVKETSRTVDKVEVSLNIGGERVSLFGSRNQVNKFVDALRKTEVG